MSVRTVDETAATVENDVEKIFMRRFVRNLLEQSEFNNFILKLKILRERLFKIYYIL